MTGTIRKSIIGFAVIAALGAEAWTYLQFREARGMAVLNAKAAENAAHLQLKGDQLEQRIDEQEALIASLRGEVSRLQDGHPHPGPAVVPGSAKQELPVAVEFDRSPLGSGFVASFRNTSPAVLEVAAVFSNPAIGQRREGTLILQPHQVAHVGYDNGWAFAPGQHVVLSNVRFRPLKLVVPEP